MEQFGLADIPMFFADTGVTATVAGVTSPVIFTIEDDVSTFEGLAKSGVMKQKLTIEAPANVLVGLKKGATVVLEGTQGNDGAYRAKSPRTKDDGLIVMVELGE